MKISAIVALVVAGLFLFSCDEHKGPGPQPETEPQENELFSVDDFPNKVGNYWSYAVYLNGAHADLLSVQVLKDTVVEGYDESVVWLLYGHFRYPSWRIPVSRSDTVVDLMLGNSYFWTSSRFIFPMVDGRNWVGPRSGDSSTVEFVGEIATAVGVFQNAYLVRSRYEGFVSSDQLETWLVPGVGIVKRRWQNFDENVWELISYEIE